MLWTIAFPLGRTPLKVFFTALFIWPLYYRFMNAYLTRPATDFLEVGESVSNRFVAIYTFLGILKDEGGEDGKGFWKVFRDFLVEKKWKKLLKDSEDTSLPALVSKCRVAQRKIEEASDNL